MDSPFASLAEARIQEALEAGEGTTLTGGGQPLDLDAYFAAPSSLRAGFSLLKNANALPPEVEALKEVARLRELMESTTDPATRHRLTQELRTREVELAMGLERVKRSLKADAVE